MATKNTIKNTKWARSKRAWLLFTLGGKCQHCGTLERLTFDLKLPVNSNHSNWNTHRRMIFYLRQHEQNNVQILCDKCNAKKGDSLELTLDTHTIECPF